MATNEETHEDRHGPHAYRTTARIVGMLFLGGMVVGIGGNGLIQSILAAPDHLATVVANSRALAIGAMLIMIAAVWDAAHGMLMLPVLKQQRAHRLWLPRLQDCRCRISWPLESLYSSPNPAGPRVSESRRFRYVLPTGPERRRYTGEPICL
jgi:hypothetical protein